MIPIGHRKNFETMQRAFRQGDVALVECIDAKTGRPVYTVCAVERSPNSRFGFDLKPLAKMFDGNPYEELLPPNPNNAPSTVEPTTFRST